LRQQRIGLPIHLAALAGGDAVRHTLVLISVLDLPLPTSGMAMPVEVVPQRVRAANVLVSKRSRRCPHFRTNSCICVMKRAEKRPSDPTWMRYEHYR
jgi:hypothetical protein